MPTLINETSDHEVKLDVNLDDPKNWLKTVSAFANRSGGIIYFGMDDDPNHTVRGVLDSSMKITKIRDLVNTKIEPEVNYTIKTLEYSGLIVIELSIMPGDQPPYYFGTSNDSKKAYIRKGDQTVVASAHFLNELIMRGRSQTFDILLSHYKKGSLGFSGFAKAYKAATNFDLTDTDYDSFHLCESEYYTNAGLLFSDHPPLLQARVFCTRWTGLDKGSIDDNAIDDAEFDGSILALLEQTKKFIKRNTKTGWTKTPDGRKEIIEYYDDAIHEALVNALVHRNYSIHGSEIHVDIFDNRIVIESPGNMYSGSPIQTMDLRHIPSVRRNPYIADVMNRLGFMERRGSGIVKMISIYQGKKLPEFHSDDVSFRTVFWSLTYSPEQVPVTDSLVVDLLKVVFESIKSNPSITKELLSIQIDRDVRTIQRYLKKLRNQGYIIFNGTNQTDGKWSVLREYSK